MLYLNDSTFSSLLRYLIKNLELVQKRVIRIIKQNMRNFLIDQRGEDGQGDIINIFKYFKIYWYAKSFQSCPTLCNPIDGSPPGSPFPGILQARTLEWVAISSSNAWKWKVKVKSLSHVRLLATPWTAAYWAPPSMGFSRQGYWSGVPLPSPS